MRYQCPLTINPTAKSGYFHSIRLELEASRFIKKHSLQFTCLLCNSPDQGIVTDTAPARSRHPQPGRALILVSCHFLRTGMSQT